MPPAQVVTPIALTGEQRRVYDEQGFTVVPDVFAAAELAAIDAELDALELASAEVDEQTHTASRPDHILGLGMRSPICQKLAQDERILSLIADIVHPGIAIYSVKMIAKPPRTDTPCHWHQDDAYYVKNSVSSCRMSVWIPLQDAHEDNGCLWVVPSSHALGLREHETKRDGLCRLSLNDDAIAPVLREQAIPVPVSAGSAVLFSALLWHGSYGNNSDTVRRAFITSYQEATAVAGNGQQWKIVRSS